METHPTGDSGVFALRETGYYGARTDDGHYLLCDAGPIGPDFLPGHAHGDIFGFELSLHGHRVVVDAGNFDYQPSAMRQYCRSTAAHNTVELNEIDQCEFWATFRVGRRGRPRQVRWQPTPNGFGLIGWHDGYRWMPGAPVHRRRFCWDQSGVLMVRDTIRSRRTVRGVSRLHLAPGCTVTDTANGRITVHCQPGGFDFWIHVPANGGVQLQHSTGWCCPQMGTRYKTHTIELKWNASRCVAGYCLAAIPIDQFDLFRGAKSDGRDIRW